MKVLRGKETTGEKGKLAVWEIMERERGREIEKREEE